MSNNNNNNENSQNATYITILCLFFFLVTTTISYRIRRYRCLNTAPNPDTNDENPPVPPARGMDAHDIESLPSLRFSEMKTLWVKKPNHLQLECSVCLNEFNGQDYLRVLLDCLHVFHSDCIDKWLSKNATCPVCRFNLDHRKGSSVRLSTVAIDMIENRDYDDDDPTVEIEGSSSRMIWLEANNNGNNVDCSRGRLYRSFSTGELGVRFVGGSSNIESIRVKGDSKAITP